MERRPFAGDGEGYDRTGGDARRVLEDRCDEGGGLARPCLGNNALHLGLRISVSRLKVR
jgi:hypothetical protein